MVTKRWRRSLRGYIFMDKLMKEQNFSGDT